MPDRIDHLLIDGRNLLYRAIYAGIGDERFIRSGHNLFVVVIRFLNDYINQFQPRRLHLFWDSMGHSLWRRDILPTYKDNRKIIKPNRIDIRKHLIEQTELCVEILPSLGITNYYKERQEADDLIYTFCRSNKNYNILIVSSDSDFKQIIYNMPNVYLYNPLAKVMVERNLNYDPVLLKSFIGDKSDNINGYYGIGEKRAIPLVNNIESRLEFFTSTKACIKEGDTRIHVGDTRFRQNLAIIDLSLCPYIIDNLMYVTRKQTNKISFNLLHIREMINKYRIRGLSAELASYVSPFKQLIEESKNAENILGDCAQPNDTKSRLRSTS